MAQRQINTFTGKRITLTTSTSYDVVLDRLNKEIQPSGPASLDSLNASGDITKDGFSEYFSTHVGPHGFIQFHEFDHGQWIQLFGIGNGLRMKRVLLGNPFVAITMLKHDLNSGLHVPVELLLKELEGRKGTEVVYVLPSSLIASVNPDEKLQSAAKELDRKFEALATHIAS
ncbi:hypothetical protein VTN96DRAFT_5204 [Rasamsonia emersonii]|uniref:DUF302 domain-containing protein n=1 Tax=Rasamsonia emersonii (strain ATCC 16479 / CBS 393.64 / IMI 116815) TaxID=1408163 RepID=A0A0F4YNG3_RASE3|nr:hypothetical protein T310_6199 [Rasamsonia emersonii CBS 393.64]KKA19807.1 hypothetical protein T310_6199 [Rasamsonia emersonii CBS 393.64]